MELIQRDPDLQHEQGDRDGEHSVAERLEACCVEVVFDPSLFALAGAGPS
jgi:hypothetical protein